jgi:hypothetical protein
VVRRALKEKTMRFIWRVWLTLLIIGCFAESTGMPWLPYVAAPLVVLLLSSYRHDVVEKLITLDKKNELRSRKS